MHVVTLGNSVSATGDFITTRAFVEALSAAHGNWSWDGRQIHGGTGTIDAHHWISTFASRFVHVHLFLLQYNTYTERDTELLLRTLLSLPQRPLVLVVEHCMLPAFYPTEEDCVAAIRTVKAKELCMPKHAQTEATRRAFMRRLALHYDIPIASACLAVDFLNQRSCAHGNASVRHPLTQSLQQTIFGGSGSDPVHYSSHGALIEGCVAAHLFLRSYNQEREVIRPPRDLPPSLSALQDSRSLWILSARDGTLEAPPSSGWKLEVGGKGGSKRWLGAQRSGASLRVRTPPCTQLSLEHYRHHELGMGLVGVRVDGRPHGTVDACCMEPCVGIAGQGYYDTVVIATQLRFVAHEVELTLLTRNRSSCAQLGHAFSVVSLLGSDVPAKEGGGVRAKLRQNLESLDMHFAAAIPDELACGDKGLCALTGQPMRARHNVLLIAVIFGAALLVVCRVICLVRRATRVGRAGS